MWIYCKKCGERTAMLSGICPDCEKKEKEVKPIVQTVYGIAPVSPAALAWLQENVTAESWQWLGGALVIEHRYIDDILAGIADAGLQPSEYELVGA